MLKILVIDDDPSTTELLTLLLKMQGFEAFPSNSGEEGIRLVREFTPDVVILDLMMPGVNGWQVCAEVRSFSLDPAGNFLFAAGLATGRLISYRVNNVTSELTQFETYDVGKEPWWVLITKT